MENSKQSIKKLIKKRIKEDSFELGSMHFTKNEMIDSMIQNSDGSWRMVTKKDTDLLADQSKVTYGQLFRAQLENLIGHETALKNNFRSCGNANIVAYQNCKHGRSVVIRIARNLFNPLGSRTFDVSTKCIPCGERNQSMANVHHDVEYHDVKVELKRPGSEDSDESSKEPQPKKRKVEQQFEPTTSVRAQPIEVTGVWKDYENLVLNCVRKEIQKSIEKVKEQCHEKDSAGKYIALLDDNPYLGIRICTAVAALGSKLKNDIAGVRQILQDKIEQSLQQTFNEESEFEVEHDMQFDRLE